MTLWNYDPNSLELYSPCLYKKFRTTHIDAKQKAFVYIILILFCSEILVLKTPLSSLDEYQYLQGNFVTHHD